MKEKGERLFELLGRKLEVRGEEIKERFVFMLERCG